MRLNPVLLRRPFLGRPRLRKAVTADTFYDPSTATPGESAPGGFHVSKRTDVRGNEFGYILSGGEGDSWQRGADGDGEPDAGSDGQMNWSANSVIVGDNLAEIDDSHAGYSGGVIPNLSDIESKWGSNWENSFPSDTDGLFNTEVILALIQSRVEAGNDSWPNWPTLNFVRRMREEGIGGKNDWYLWSQDSSTNHAGDGTGSTQTAGEESDVFWEVMKGYATDLSQGGSPEADIPEIVYPFFYKRPDDSTEGAEAFDAYRYWASTESGSAAYFLIMNGGGRYTGAKDNTRCVRVARRVYL